MAQKPNFGLSAVFLLLASLSVGGAQAQGPAAVAIPSSRLAGNWHTSPSIALTGSRPPLSSLGLTVSGVDQGAAPANQKLPRMLLLLSPSAAQQQALAAELAALQNPASPQYHQWLTPSAFAGTYANSPADVAAVVAWLQSEGFQVAALPAGRGWIEFSGTVAQVEQAFQTQVHLVSGAYGSARPVAVSGISVPAALQPLIGGLVSLDGIVSIPAITVPQPLSVSEAELAAETSLAGADALTPQLEAQLVDLGPLTKSGVTGAGQTIAIVSRSNVNVADVAAFRNDFGIPVSPLTVTLNGSDPGFTDGQAEATLAASWAGAAAPGAQILLVPAASTDATDGVDLSLTAIVDGDLASTLAVGYSACEAGMSAAHQEFYSALYQQASAEGMAVIAAAGDSGAAACSVPGGASVSTGYGVNALSSTPWDTAVGVAALGASGATTTANSAASTALNAWSPVDPADPAYAGGGGGSTVYRIPRWQPLPSSLPSGASKSNRLLPDVSLPTALDTSTNPGLAFCLSAATPSSSGCTLFRSGGSGAAASYFAGIAALMASQNGAEGNLAPTLYQLSSRSGIFNDVQQGSTQLPCAAGSPGCAADGQIGYAAGAGFDLATGLGVPNATNLVRAKPLVNGISPVTVTNNIAPGQTINPSGSLVLSATVDSGSGGTPPTGTVEFYDQSTGTNLGVDTLTPATGTTSTVQQTSTGVFAQGVHSIIAEYNGDATYAASNSGAESVTVQLSSTSTTAVPVTYAPSPGASFSVTATVTATNAGLGAAAPSGSIQFQIDGATVATVPLVAGASSGTTTTASATTNLTAPTTAASHSINAIYSGDGNYTGSTSPAATITVGKSATTTAVTPISNAPAPGSNFSVTAVVTSAGAGVGAPAPTGTVTFEIDGTASGSALLVAGTPSGASTNASATATLIAPTGVGAHSINAVYPGDNTYGGSTSAAASLPVGKGATTTTVAASPATLTPNTPEALTATVLPSISPSGPTTAISGTVSFYDGATLLGQATIVTNSATISNVTLAANVAHSITVVYSGDANWLTSTSAVLPLGATALPVTVTLATNSNTGQPGGSIILSATVTPNSLPLANTEQNPTGTVVFYQGTTEIGSASLAPSTGDSSIATLTVQTLPGGQNQLTANYRGDAYFDPGTSSPITVNVEAFTIAPAAGNPVIGLTLTQGASGSESFVVTGQGGFNNLVQVICTPPANDNITCTSSPQQVTPPSTVTFVVQTSTTPIASNHPAGPVWPRVGGGAALAGLVFFLLPFGRRARSLVGASSRRMLILLLLLVGLGAAGIGCSASSTLAPFGTPLGVATVKVTATAYVNNAVTSQTLYFTVNVVQ